MYRRIRRRCARRRGAARVAGEALEQQGRLVGVDLAKDASTLVAAYDDAAGVTAAAAARRGLTLPMRQAGQPWSHAQPS